MQAIPFRLILLMLMLMQSLTSTGQDKLLMTDGKYRDLKGKVTAIEFDRIVYQTARQAQREAGFLSRTGQDKERFDAVQAELTASAAERLERRRREFEAQQAVKADQLTEVEFEKWRSEQLVRLKEAEMTATLSKTKRKKGRFTRTVPRELVFAILEEDSVEIVVYSADTLGFLADGSAEVEYGIEEMRRYIKGRQHGRMHRTALDAMLGAGIGTVSAYLGSFWGPAGPSAYIIIASIANTKIQFKADVDPGLLTDPAYIDGYERSAKRKKTWDFVKGSVAGLGFGFALFQGVFR